MYIFYYGILQLLTTDVQLVLPKLLVNNEDFEDTQHLAIDFDKILQSLVLTMEHPDPFVRKVAMYWMTRIVQAHISPVFKRDEIMGMESMKGPRGINADAYGATEYEKVDDFFGVHALVESPIHEW